jgi:DNA-binding SARP family transcriptional activator
MVETPVVIRAIHESVDISLHLDAGSDWTLASEILKSAWRLFEQLDGAGGRRTILEAELLNRTLSWLRRSNDNDEFDRHLARMLEITEPGGDGDGEELLRFRLRAFRHLHSRCAASDYPRCRDVWERVERLIERAPLLFGADVHIHYLEEVARAAQLLPDPAMLRLVEERLDRITTSPILPDGMKEMARERVAHALLQLFDTEEELARKMALLRELPRRIDGSNASLVLNQIALLETTGWMEEALAEATDSLQRFRKFGLMRNAAHVELISLCARAALGVDFAQIERDAVRLGSNPGYSSSPRFRSHIGIYLTKIGMLAGKLEWTRRIIAAFGADGTLFWPEGNLLLAREDGTMAEAVEALPQNEEPFATLRLLARAIAAGEESAPYAASLLARPLLRLDDLLMLRVILTVIGQRRVEGERRALVRALAWLEERRLASLMASFLEDFASRLPKKEASAWRGRLRALTSERPVGAAEPEAKLRISMLGTIAVSDADGRMQPIRGARVRAMLGLLVAARMVREPLTHREYCRLAAGGEVEPELARKTANMAVVRLREAVGADTVLTGEETHHLNLDRVSVDLLEAQALIDESREALRRRALLRAFPTLKRALELTHGEVPFPGLYDDFFEAIRDDFEFTLRTTVIDVARALLRESDAASAGEILSLAFDGMPDDEEIMELLHETLAAVGKRADAERVRMRAEEALEPAERL